MNDLQLQLQLRNYTIKSSFSGHSALEEPFLSPRTFQPQPRIFPSSQWYTSPHIIKTSAQGPVHIPIMAPRPLTTVALLTFLLAGFTLTALLAYSSPLQRHNDPTMNSGVLASEKVISKNVSALETHSTSPGLLTIHTNPTQPRKSV